LKKVDFLRRANFLPFQVLQKRFLQRKKNCLKKLFFHEDPNHQAEDFHEKNVSSIISFEELGGSFSPKKEFLIIRNSGTKMRRKRVTKNKIQGKTQGIRKCDN